MKKLIYFSLIAFILLGMAGFSLAQEEQEKPVTLYYFYGETCPNCKKAKVFLDKLEDKYPSLEIQSYEVFSNRDNAELFLELLESRDEEKRVRVPAVFIGQEVIIGYLNDQTTGEKIEQAIIQCMESEQCIVEPGDDSDDQIITYPIIGQINLSKLSLPVLTILLAALDGFNPCAMWILLFLIALLINLHSRKRIWLIGGTFIAASGIIYYLLLAAWLNLFLAISYVSLTRMIIGVLAVVVGVWQIRKFTTFKPGVCEVAPIGGRWNQRLSEKAKQVVESGTLSATLIGVILLALGVNLIEFFCSAGLPAIYTQILSLSHLSSVGYYLYLLLYTFIFMLDDMIIFAIAIITLSKIGFTEKYNKWSTLVGGVLILILGLMLIFKPDLLMFA